MKQNKFDIVFHTPAFLGDAQQSGCWRTPPFKAQLRQWWRVVYWTKHQEHFSLEAMRQAEGHLFGNAWLKDGFQKSQVRMRINHWREGSLQKKDWKSGDRVVHPEVGETGRQIDSHLYLGFGPVTNKTGIKENAAIQVGEEVQLSIAYPKDHAVDIEQALQLMNLYGTVGGRSRNSWGSYSCRAFNQSADTSPTSVFKNWEECLRQDWPHAIGNDNNGPLIWHTTPHQDWKSLLGNLAEIKIRLRTNFKFPEHKVDGQVHDRHWLSYPVTHHNVISWDKTTTGRLPNTLRFKVRPTADGQLIGVIFHMPHLPPAAFQPKIGEITRVWSKVHRLLDEQNNLKRQEI